MARSHTVEEARQLDAQEREARSANDVETLRQLTGDRCLCQLETELLAHLTLSGIPGVRKVFTNAVPRAVWDPDHGCSMQREWVVHTAGSNLAEMLAHPDVDATRTVSNNVREVYTVLGIEAARASLLRELQNVLADSNAYVVLSGTEMWCVLSWGPGLR